MAMLSVTQCQRAVGQGGFQTTELQFGQHRYRAVYDCGSLPKEGCLRQIDAFAAELDGQEIDLLALSHLDEDHCNGVEELLAQCGARTVMLPYLNDVARLVEMAARAATGRLTGTAVALLTDPGQWFLDRGASEVIEVEPAPDEGPQSPAASTERPYEPPSGKGPLGTHVFKDSVRFVSPDGRRTRLAAGQPVLCGEDVYAQLWLFLPFAIRGVEPRQQAFLAECNTILELPPVPIDDATLSQALREQMQKPGKRRALAAAYDLVASRRNSTSMALYGGPARPVDPAEWGRNAWLSTGDWPLAVQRRRAQFMDFYRNYASQVDTFCVPHHGSRHNFPPAAFWHWLNPRLAVIAAGELGEHPHEDVIANLVELVRTVPNMVGVRTVTEDSRTTFVRMYRLEV